MLRCFLLSALINSLVVTQRGADIQHVEAEVAQALLVHIGNYFVKSGFSRKPKECMFCVTSS